MLFNSYQFMFLFLPLTLLVYWGLLRGAAIRRAGVFAAGLIFYAWYDVKRNPDVPFEKQWDGLKRIAAEIDAMLKKLAEVLNTLTRSALAAGMGGRAIERMTQESKRIVRDLRARGKLIGDEGQALEVLDAAGIEVLDLFAGTGAVGIEALSRGAAGSFFVDAHPSAVKLIRANLASLGVGTDRFIWLAFKPNGTNKIRLFSGNFPDDGVVQFPLGIFAIALATEGDEAIGAKADHVLTVPEAPELLSPVVNIIPLQLLAYQLAVRRGCDVDQPRNLAKSVTVE